MSVKRDYYLHKGLEDSNQSVKENSSLLYQIPMNYKDYQEMRDSSTRTSSRPTNYTNQSAANLKLLTETEESLKHKQKTENFDSIMTPIFSNNKTQESSGVQTYGTHNKSSIYSKLDTSRDQEERYRKFIESALHTVERLKNQKEKLSQQLDQYSAVEEEISKNSKMCLADLNEKHKKALDQLEKYFYTNVTKIKDLEAQKKEALKDKHSASKNHIQELATLINAMEAKIQLEPMQTFIHTYEDRFYEIEKFLSLLPSDENVFDQGWKTFPSVPLELDLKHKHHHHEKHHENIKPAVEHRPRKENIGKENHIPSLPVSSKMSQATSPKMKTESDSSNTSSAKHNNTSSTRNPYDFSLNEKKAAAKQSLHQSPLKYLQAIDLNTTDINKIRPREKVEQQKEYPVSRASIKPELISERPSQKSERYSYNQRLEDDIGRENIRTARLPYEDRLLATERGNEENRDPAFGHKSKKYKHIIKKLEQETKEKDHVIKEMIKSYKDLEHVITGNGSGLRKRSRSKNRSEIDKDILKSTTHLPKEKKLEASPKLTHSNREKKLSKDMRNPEPSKVRTSTIDIYENTKNKYKNLRGEKSSKEQTMVGRSIANEPSLSNLGKRDLSRTRSIDLHRKSDLKLADTSTIQNEEKRNTVRPRETNYERTSVVDEDGRFKVKVYVPTGDVPYSDYQMIKLNKHNTVNDLLEKLLNYIGISENKYYKYYIGMKMSDQIPEKILLQSELLRNYIDKDQDKKSGSWPKFFLRSYTDKPEKSVRRI